MIFPRGAAAVVFDRVYDSCVMLLSKPVLIELREVAERPKFDRYLKIAERQDFVERYASATKLIPISEAVRDCRDAKDDKFLELALSGRADVIVTGDVDLLCLHPWRGVAILIPADYLAQLD
jgi:putative PIN family toxin of toxin-antitoxin system